MQNEISKSGTHFPLCGARQLVYSGASQECGALPVPEPRRSRDAISEALELDVSELQWERLVEDVNAFVGARDAGQLDARSLLADRFRTTLSLHHNTDMSEAPTTSRRSPP